MMQDDFYILYDDPLSWRDWLNFAALLWRIPLAVAGAVIEYAILKAGGYER